MTSETDALANMMAADSRRVDQMVDDLGQVKGKVEAVHKGVDELRAALTVLVRHEVLMETSNKAVIAMADKVEAIDSRVHSLESEMPGMREVRGWAMRGMFAVLAVVGFGLLALVIKR